MIEIQKNSSKNCVQKFIHHFFFFWIKQAFSMFSMLVRSSVRCIYRFHSGSRESSFFVMFHFKQFLFLSLAFILDCSYFDSFLTSFSSNVFHFLFFKKKRKSSCMQQLHLFTCNIFELPYSFTHMHFTLQ